VKELRIVKEGEFTEKFSTAIQKDKEVRVNMCTLWIPFSAPKSHL
jgi:hypothetical protein